MRAVEHNRLAKAAVLAKAPTLAHDQFVIATVARLCSRTEVTRNYRAGIKIDLAKLAAEENDSRAAFRYLAELPLRPPKSLITIC